LPHRSFAPAQLVQFFGGFFSVSRAQEHNALDARLDRVACVSRIERFLGAFENFIEFDLDESVGESSENLAPHLSDHFGSDFFVRGQTPTVIRRRVGMFHSTPDGLIENNPAGSDPHHQELRFHLGGFRGFQAGEPLRAALLRLTHEGGRRRQIAFELAHRVA
jgi:hypothetical protein